jgi:hypothetical protein
MYVSFIANGRPALEEAILAFCLTSPGTLYCCMRSLGHPVKASGAPAGVIGARFFVR